MDKTPLQDMQLLKQGAEAKLYSGLLFGRPTIVKERFVKSYRHPTLDRALTTRRIRAEVKCIQRCRANGIHCPAIYFVDMEASTIYMEYLTDSVTVKEYIIEKSASGKTTNSSDWLSSLLPLAEAIGKVVGTMHASHIIHGDLTTSNLLLRNPEDVHISVIDFGLSGIEETAEDKGVDLYVLERAFLSTHPSTESLFEAILKGYREAYIAGCSGAGKAGGRGAAAADDVLRKLDEIRLRGRKRTMVG